MKRINQNTVELTAHEMRQSVLFNDYLDQGWDINTAIKYTARRLGPVTGAFYQWLAN